jgi:hypothetical protein
MADLADIRAGMKANLSAIPNLQIAAYVLSNPTPPAAEIEPGPIKYDLTYGRGTDEWALTVRVFVAGAADIGAQVRLDRMLSSAGPESVKAALESDKTLGGAVDTIRVTDCSGYRLYARENGAAVLGAEWQVTALGSGQTP